MWMARGQQVGLRLADCTWASESPLFLDFFSLFPFFKKFTYKIRKHK